MSITRFSFPTTIHFGAGARRLAGPHLAERDFRRPMVVTDRGLAALPLIAESRAALGSVCDLHHGLANAPMTEPMMAFNMDAVPQKFAELAHVVGATVGSWLAHLKRQFGITPGLAAVGVKRAQIARLVEIAASDACHASNPRACTRADFERFFTEAF